MRSSSFVSVVSVVKNDDFSTFCLVVSQIQEQLDVLYSDYEIVIVAIGPITNMLVDNVESMLNELPSIRYLQLSSDVPLDVAWAAGLENAIGDFVVLFDHGMDPVAVVAQVVDICKSGFDVVVGVSTWRQTYIDKVLSESVSSILNAIDYKLPRHATGLRCLSRRAVNAVTNVGRFHHQLYMRIQKTGYPTQVFEYDIQADILKGKSLYKDLRRFVSLLVFNSSKPLRCVSGVGILGSGVAFLFALYSLVIHLVSGNVVQGWTTTILFTSVLFMLQFIMMAFFGEYIGRLLDDRSEHMDYFVVFEKNSNVMVSQDRVNVLCDSVDREENRVQTARNG